MADQNYIIQLSDGQQLSIPQQYIKFYPTINDIIESPLYNPDQAILLPYDDPEALYLTFTTPIQEESHRLDMYVRLANAIDFLGNDDVLNQFMAALVMVQFRTDKENTKEILRNLNNGPQHWLLNNTISPRLGYKIDYPIGTQRYGRAVSDDLSYVVVWISPNYNIPGAVLYPGQQGLQRLTVYKDGQEIMNMRDPPQFPTVSGKLVIDDNGTIYSVDEISDIYVWSQPDYIPQLYKSPHYKNVEREFINLSSDAQRYIQFVTRNTSYKVVELATGNILSQFLPYDAPPIASPHMDILFVEYLAQNKDNHAIWVVDNNTTNWLELPESEVLLISHSENIIATTSSQPQANGTYGVAIYKRRGINFVPPADDIEVVGQPVAVSEKYLLTKQGASGDIINVHNIINQLVERLPAHTISIRDISIRIPEPSYFPMSHPNFRLQNIVSGPHNTFLFILTSANGHMMHFIKYSIQGYANIEKFFEARLDIV